MTWPSRRPDWRRRTKTFARHQWASIRCRQSSRHRRGLPRSPPWQLTYRQARPPKETMRGCSAATILALLFGCFVEQGEPRCRFVAYRTQTNKLCTTSNSHDGENVNLLGASLASAPAVAGVRSLLRISLTYMDTARKQQQALPRSGLALHHERMLHAVVLGADMRTMFHVHPDDFQQSGVEGMYDIYVTLRNAGNFTVHLTYAVNASHLDLCVTEGSSHAHVHSSGGKSHTLLSASQIIPGHATGSPQQIQFPVDASMNSSVVGLFEEDGVAGRFTSPLSPPSESDKLLCCCAGGLSSVPCTSTELPRNKTRTCFHVSLRLYANGHFLTKPPVPAMTCLTAEITVFRMSPDGGEMEKVLQMSKYLSEDTHILLAQYPERFGNAAQFVHHSHGTRGLAKATSIGDEVAVDPCLKQPACLHPSLTRAEANQPRFGPTVSASLFLPSKGIYRLFFTVRLDTGELIAPAFDLVAQPTAEVLCILDSQIECTRKNASCASQDSCGPRLKDVISDSESELRIGCSCDVSLGCTAFGWGTEAWPLWLILIFAVVAFLYAVVLHDMKVFNLRCSITVPRKTTWRPLET